MKCKNCGYKLEKGQSECPRCGTAFDAKRNKKKKIGTAAGVAATVGGATAMVADAVAAGKEIKEEQTIKNELSIQWNEKETKPALNPPDISLTTGEVKTPDDIKISSNVVSSIGGGMSEEQLKQLLLGSGLNEQDINKLLEAYKTGNLDTFNNAIAGVNASNYETALMNELRSKGLSDDQITRVLDAYKSGDQNQIYSILNEGVQIDPLKSEAEIRTALANKGLSEADIDKVVAASQSGGMEEAEKVLAEMGEQYAKAYQQSIIDELKSQGLTDEQAAKVLAAYNSGDQEQVNAALNEVAVSKMLSSREEIAASLSGYGFTDEEIDRVYNAAQSGGVEEANAVINEIAGQRSQEYESSMREQLKSYGFSDEEVARVMHAAQTGGTDEANSVLSEIASQHAAEAEATVVSDLKEQGLNDSEIDRFLEAYRTGDQEKVTEVLTDISNERMMQQEQEMRASLSEYGFSDEEIDRVMDAAKNGGADEANQVIQEIGNQHMEEQQAALASELRENGLSEEEIAQVIEAYKTGDQETVESTLGAIQEKHFEASIEEMKVSLAEAGLSEEEIARVEAAAREGGNEAAQSVLEEINNQRMDEYEQELRGNLSEAGVDDETIERMVQAFRDGDKDGMEAIYAEINQKRIDELRASLEAQGIKKHYIDAIIAAYEVGNQDRINQIYAKIQEEAEQEAAAAQEAGLRKQLEEMGITNPADIEAALAAYREGGTDAVKAFTEELFGEIAHETEEGGVELPSAFHVEALLGQLGSTSRYGCARTTAANNAEGRTEFQNQFASLAAEFESGGFSQYDKEGVCTFGNIDISFGGAGGYSSLMSDYFNFIDTLKQNLTSIRDLLIKWNQSEDNYYNSVDRELLMNMVDSSGEANTKFFSELESLRIPTADLDGDYRISLDERQAFATDIARDLADYYDDTEYDPTKLATYGAEDHDKAVSAYESDASLIAFLINQASLAGLINLDEQYLSESGRMIGEYAEQHNQTYNEFIMGQFNEHCREGGVPTGAIRFDYDPETENFHQLLATSVFQREMQISMDKKFDTDLYKEFIGDLFTFVGYNPQNGVYPNYELTPDAFAYTILRMASMKEAFDDGRWRGIDNSKYFEEYYDSYGDDAYSTYTFDDFLRDRGVGRQRSSLGNDVVNLFTYVITYDGMGSEERLNRSLQYGSNYEEAFYLSWQLYDVVGPQFEGSNEDVYNFMTALNGTGEYTPISFSRLDVDTRMRMHELFPDMVDANGRLIGLYTDLTGPSGDILRRDITAAALMAQMSLKNEDYTRLVYQMAAFYAFVSPTYSQDADGNYFRADYQNDGNNIYLWLLDEENHGSILTNLRQCLEHSILSYDDFLSSDLASQYEDYQDYCYNNDGRFGSLYYGNVARGLPSISAFFDAKASAEGTSATELYNNFNDSVVRASLNYSNVNLSGYQFKQGVEQYLTQESSSGKMSEGATSFGDSFKGAWEAMCFLVSTDEDKQQEHIDKCFEYMDTAQYHWDQAERCYEFKHMYTDRQAETANIINNLTYETFHFTTRFSFYEEWVAKGMEHFSQYHIKPKYGFDADGMEQLEGYECVDENGNPVDGMSPEEMAIVLLNEKNNGVYIDWSVVETTSRKYAENIGFLNSDSNNINYDAVLGYLMFSYQSGIENGNNDELQHQLSLYSNLGFDLEARRRADEYTKSKADEWFSDYLNGVITDPEDLQRTEIAYNIVRGGEWLIEDVLFPALHGIDGFFHSIGYAVSDTAKMLLPDLFGHVYETDYSPSLTDQTWAYVIQNYKDSGGLDMASYYVTQAMISMGNQAIPIAVSCIPGCQGVGMWLLGISAYGNTLHSTLGEFVQLGHYNEVTQQFEWAEGRAPINAFFYACIDAAAEMYLEKFLGGMPGLSDATRVGIGGFCMDIASEMLEESMQEFLGPLFKDIATGDIVRSIQEDGLGGYVTDFLGNKVDLEAIRDAAIIAAISSGVMNGIQSGPDIVKSLWLTDGKSSSLLQLLKLNSQAMAQAGFTSEQIQTQYALSLQGALANVDMLSQIETSLLNSPSFQAEYESWKEGLGKNDPRSELNIRDFAKMRAIEKVSFDTTEMQLQLQANNNRITELQNKLIGNTGTLAQYYQSFGTNNTAAMLTEIQELRAQNVTISEQIQEYRAKAHATFNTNTETITQLETDIKGLKEQLKTCTEEERAGIQTQINEKTGQMNSLITTNNIINLTINDNVEVLEAQIAQNEKVLSQLREKASNDKLGSQIIETLNDSITELETQQTDLNSRLGPARETLAATLVQREGQLLAGIASFERINEKLNKKTATETEIEYYNQNKGTINKLKKELKIVQSKIADLEEKGVKVEGRTTAEIALTVIENMQRRLEESTQQRLAAMEERAASQGQTRITVNEETKVQFTKQMSLVIAPLLMQMGFSTGSLIGNNGTIIQNWGPSCGRIINMLREQNSELTIKLDGTIDTDTDTRADIQSQIDSNSEAIGSLTELMAKFGIGENSPLTALMEKMQLEKMQLEEIRHANNEDGFVEVINEEDATLELEWNLNDILNSDMSNQDKIEAIRKVVEDIRRQTLVGSFEFSKLNLDGIFSNMTVDTVIEFLQKVNTENIQRLFDTSSSNIEVAEQLLALFKKLNIDSKGLKQINISGLVIEGHAVKSLNLYEFIATQIENKHRIEYDVLRGKYKLSDVEGIKSFRGLTQEETADFLKISDMMKTIKDSIIHGKNYKAAVEGLKPYLVKYGMVEIGEVASLSSREVFKNAALIVSKLKNDMIDAGVGLMRTSTTADGKVKINIYGSVTPQNIRIGYALENKLQKLYESLPAASRASITELRLFLDCGNPGNDYWLAEFNNPINPISAALNAAAATGGNGEVSFWNLKLSPLNMDRGTLLHETGHNIDTMISKFLHGKYGFWTEVFGEWNEAKKADGIMVSFYGQNAIAEDFAEAYMKYIQSPRWFAFLHPHRAALLESQLTQLTNELINRGVLTSTENLQTQEVTETVSVQDATFNAQVASINRQIRETLALGETARTKLQTEIEELYSQLSTCTEQERLGIEEQIGEKRRQIVSLDTQRTVAQLALNGRVLTQINMLMNNNQLNHETIDALRLQIDTISRYQFDANNPTYKSVRENLSIQQQQIEAGLRILTIINEATNVETATQAEINYRQINEQNIERLNGELDGLRGLVSALDQLSDRTVPTIDKITAPIQTDLDIKGEFTRQISYVIAPILLQHGFSTLDLVRNDGTLTHNWGPSCGRILNTLKGRNEALTLKLNLTSDTDTEVRTDLQSRIDSNNEAINTLTELMARFNIGENSPLTSLMEKMQLSKFQLEEIRNANKGITSERHIGYEDMMLELRWNIEEVLNSDMSNLEKFKVLQKIITDVSTQYGNDSFLSDTVMINSIDGLEIPGGINIKNMLFYLSQINTENIQRIFNMEMSIFGKAQQLVDIFMKLNISTEELAKINIEGLVIDGKAVKSFNIHEFIVETQEQMKKIEFATLSAPIGQYDKTQMLEKLTGLTTEETAAFYRLSDMIKVLKESRDGSIRFNRNIKQLRSELLTFAYLMNNSEAKQRLLNNSSNLTMQDVEYLSTEIILSLKNKMIKVGIGLLKTTKTADGRVNLRIYGNDTTTEVEIEALRVKFEKMYEALPATAKAALKNVELFFDTPAPHDEHFAVRYDGNIKSGYVTAATGGYGNISFWNLRTAPEHMDYMTLCHESGHNIDVLFNQFLFNKGGYWSEISKEWQQAIKEDGNSVSQYGNKKVYEDFAETYKFYVADPKAFAKKFPHRAALLESMLTRLNQAMIGKNIITQAQLDSDATVSGYETSGISSQEITVVPAGYEAARATLEAIKNPDVNINELGIDSATINRVLKALSPSEKIELFDAIYERLVLGQTINNATYNAIFTSDIFTADSEFAQNYLHHFLEKMLIGESTDSTKIAAAQVLADRVTEIYAAARESTNEQRLSNLYSYCDHTEAHTLQVAFLSMKALNAISEESVATTQYSQATEAEYREIFVAGLLHDLGMAAGMIEDGHPMMYGVNIETKYNEVSKTATLVASLIDLSMKKKGKLSNIIRENHTLNSAVAILSMRSELEALGLDADRLAMLCFSHSKSNSGVGLLTEASDWALCVTKIQEAVAVYNANNPTNQVSFNLEKTIGTQASETAPRIKTTSEQKTSSKKLNGKKIQVQLDVRGVEFVPGFVKQMATKAFALRVGDAFVSKAKIQLETPKRWTYNGVTYTATEAILTQTGRYMLYDKSRSDIHRMTEADYNSFDTETADQAAFIYFGYNSKGEFVPCRLDDTGKLVPYESGEIAREADGTFKLTDDKSFMSLMDGATYVATINGVEIETVVTVNNYLQVSQETKTTMPDGETKTVTTSEYYTRVRSTTPEGKLKIDYALTEYSKKVEEIGKNKTVTYYKTDANGIKVEISESEFLSVIGEEVRKSSGQFLSGESNVTYNFSRGTLEDITGGKTVAGLISEMIIGDPSSFPYNAISKGLDERFGELLGALGIKRFVNIKFNNHEDFERIFEVVEVDGKKFIRGRSDIDLGRVYQQGLSKIVSDYTKTGNKIEIRIEGYALETVEENTTKASPAVTSTPSIATGVAQEATSTEVLGAQESVVDTADSQAGLNQVEYQFAEDTSVSGYETTGRSSIDISSLTTEELITQLSSISDADFQMLKDDITARIKGMNNEDLMKLYMVATNSKLIDLLESRIVTYKLSVPGLKQYLHTLGVKPGLLTNNQLLEIENTYKAIQRWKQDIESSEKYAALYGAAAKAQIPQLRRWVEESYVEIQNIINTARAQTKHKAYISYNEFLRNNAEVRKAWEATLTEEEWMLLKGYKSEYDLNPGSYSALNTLLRFGKDAMIDTKKKVINFKHTGNKTVSITFEQIERSTGLTVSEFIEDIGKAVIKLDEIIRRSSLAEDMTLYRGIAPEALKADFGIDIKNDSESVIQEKLSGIFRDKGFMSTSATMNSEFFDNSAVVLILNCSKGTPAIDLATINADEQEVLLSYGQKFIVEKVEKVNINGKPKVYIYLTTVE